MTVVVTLMSPSSCSKSGVCPIWKKDADGETLDGAKPAPTLREGGTPVRTGKWQIMINGESYKCIVAEPAKTALGADNIHRAYLYR